MSIRRQGSRFAWLMTGAAIGTTVVLVLALVVPIARQQLVPIPLLVLGLLVAIGLGGLLGLVPGVRELEVTAARSMLGVETELVVPSRPGPVHRLQDVLWVQIHLLLGLLTAACLMMLAPAAVVSLLGVFGVISELSVVGVPDSTVERIVVGAASLLALAAALLATWPLGALAARLAPRLLGPTAGDRLDVALARADREAERTRIARDLHDGIGHALTIVSIQAAAGGRVLHADPDAAGDALSRIERTAHEALVDLDGVLAELREDGGDGMDAGGAGGVGDMGDGADTTDGSDSSTSAAATARLDSILEDHRRAGMDLRAEVVVPPALPGIQHEHLLRIVTELLTNAHRHGGDGPVDLCIGSGRSVDGERAVIVETENPLPVPGGAGPSGGSTPAAGSIPAAGSTPETPPTRAAASAPSAASTPALSTSVASTPALPTPTPSDPVARTEPSVPTGSEPHRPGGRGLTGLCERLDLWGGALEAGPADGRWRSRAVIPLLSQRPGP